MAPKNDDDLDLEPIHKGRGRAIAIGVLVVAGGGAIAYFANTRFSSTRRTDSLARTAQSWAQLRQCLVGDQLHGRDRPSALLRRIEITLPRGQRDLPENERLQRWPYRCATYASVMTHALFEANSDEPNHRLLATVASRAASALDQGQLRTGHDDPSGYLDELFGAAELANLPPANPGNVPAPPTAGHPLAVPQMYALTAGAGSGTFVSTDPVVDASLRLVLGATQRSLCTFRNGEGANAALANAHCVSLPFASGAAHLEPVAGDADATPMVRLAIGATPGDVHVSEGGIGPFARNVTGPWSASHGVFSAFVAPTAPATAWSFTRIRGVAAPVTVPVTFPIADAERVGAPIVVDDLAFVTSRAPATAAESAATTGGDAGVNDAAVVSTDASVATADGATGDGGSSDAAAPGAPRAPGHLYAATIAATDPPALAFASIGEVASPERDIPLSVCRFGDQLAVAVHGAWHRTTVLFRRAGRWSQPVDGLAQPGAFTCRRDEATFTWMETQGRRRVHQLRCTPERCTAAEAIPPTFDGDVIPAVTDVDGKVLLVASPGPSHGLQMVFAPIDRIANTEPVVLIDDGEHGGVELAPAVSVFSRTSTGVILVNTSADPYTSYAIRVVASGEFSAIHTD